MEIKVFVSSTTKGLQLHRDAVVQAINRMDGHNCINMEKFGARNATSLEFSRAMCRTADVFVAIVGPHYGSRPVGSKFSFTEHEYNEAVAIGLPRLIFVTPDDFPTRESEREDEDCHSRQQAFRERVRKERIVDQVDEATGPAGLAIAVVLGLNNLNLRARPAQPPPPAPASQPWAQTLAPLPSRGVKPMVIVAGAGAVLLFVAIGISLQHFFVVSHRYPDGMVEVPAGVYHHQTEESPLLTLMRRNDKIANLDFLLDPPPSQITLPSYYIDRTEVTNAEYRRFVNEQKPGVVKDPQYWSDARFNQPDQPVVGVNWAEADQFCRGRGKRLPSGDEWERASRGQDGRLYPWGDTFDPQAANTAEGPAATPSRVGSYPLDRSPEGVLDLAGNVREWTAEEGQGPDGAAAKFVRGAAYDIRGDIYALGFLRIASDPNIRQEDLGFRCAESAVGASGVPEGMVLMPAGMFRKGSEDEPLLNLARRMHLNGDGVRELIAVRPEQGAQPAFGLDRSEVTNASYRSFLEAASHDPAFAGKVNTDKTSLEPDSRTWNERQLNQPKQPVVGVDWYDAVAYCGFVGKRLPSSLEWERAAGGPEGLQYPWGNKFERDRCNTADAFHPEGKPAEVEKYSRCISPSGIVDLVGNVDEWTITDAREGSKPELRVIRGGSWRDSGELRGLSRFEAIADARYRGADVGFRCAADPRRSWLETGLMELK